MEVQFTDFNGADAAIAQSFPDEWQSLFDSLQAMPLHLKASDQAGIQGKAIFDPVGTNEHIASALHARGWRSKIVIPEAFSFLGTDVDFAKNGTVVEAQFSNYPFLLNNVIRSELFFRSGTIFHQKPSSLIFLVTKAGMFPASNSTLYYEQGVSQLQALAQHEVFTVPIRLVGLFSPMGEVMAKWSVYSSSRYSRTLQDREVRPFNIHKPAGGRATASNRCRIVPVLRAEDL
jgi:hypothetical protein